MSIIRNINRRSFLYDYELEYIHTNAKQMFLTDWIAGYKPKIELDFRRENVKYYTGGHRLFCNQRYNVQDYDPKTNVNFGINNGDGSHQINIIFIWNNLRYRGGGTVISQDISCFNGKRNKMSMDWNYYRWTDGEKQYERKIDLRTGKSKYPLYLFGYSEIIDNVRKYYPYFYSELYIYGVKLYNDDILERNYIPYFRGNTAGLLDTITNTFWTSETGTHFLPT